jgi:1-acyl-sn-glycerol-3-phosphate acyltransferase
VRNAVYRLIVAIGGGYFRLLGLRRTVIGTEHVPASGGAVLAISHFSYLDFALAEWAVWRDRRRYTRFMATAASFRHPLSGPLMRSMRHIPVDRDTGAAAFQHALRVLGTGDLVGVFPESRVSASFTLLPFKTGAVRMAQAAGVPVVPCVVWGSHRVMTRTHRPGFWKARRTPVTIVFGAPITVAPDEESAAVTATLHTEMTRMLEQAIDGYPVVAEPGAWWVPAHRGGGAPEPDSDERTVTA